MGTPVHGLGQTQEATPKTKKSQKYMAVQAFLCILCCLVGAFYPTLLDWSKTALEREVSAVDNGGSQLLEKERRSYPFSPVSVVLVNDALQLSIALVAVAMKTGLSSLVADGRLALKMLPLGMIYAIGELLTLRSVQKGSGPVYVVIANMKLVVAAVMSRLFFGQSRSLPCLHWLELVLISCAAAAYTLAEAGSMGSQWNWEGAWAALAKSSLVAFSSVFCEHTYKSNPFHAVLALQAFWGLVTVVVIIASAEAGFGSSGFLGTVALELQDDDGFPSLLGGGPSHPLCDSIEHAACLNSLQAGAASCTCLSSRGWDAFTLLAVVADLSNAISSALVFRRLSAVAKYVCRASSAVPMYLFYCAVGRSSWDPRIFFIVILLCMQVGIYAMQRNRAENQAEAAFVQHYTTGSKNL